MKLTVLMENTASEPHFFAEHGLSLYLETSDHKILFDLGQSGRFADNAAQLGIDLSAVDLAVLSHGHYDHGGGIRRFLECNDHAPIYISRSAFGSYYHGTRKYIGLNQALKSSPRLIPTDDLLHLNDTLTLCTCNGKAPQFPLDSAGLTEEANGAFVPDCFSHEQYLLIQEAGRTIVLSGCSHKGVLNIVHWLHPDILIGGFHFMDQPVPPKGNPILDHVAKALLVSPVQYYTCHCTGIEPYRYLKAKMQDRLHYLSAGRQLTL